MLTKISDIEIQKMFRESVDFSNRFRDKISYNPKFCNISEMKNFLMVESFMDDFDKFVEATDSDIKYDKLILEKYNNLVLKNYLPNTYRHCIAKIQKNISKNENKI